MEEGRSAPAGAETLRTADLDSRGILQLQTATMAEQDAQLEELERSVASTKHIALTVNEELGLQTRLLDELDEDVEGTHSRMRAAQKRLKARLFCHVTAIVGGGTLSHGCFAGPCFVGPGNATTSPSPALWRCINVCHSIMLPCNPAM